MWIEIDINSSHGKIYPNSSFIELARTIKRKYGSNLDKFILPSGAKIRSPSEFDGLPEVREKAKRRKLMTPDEIKEDIRDKLYELTSEVSDGWVSSGFDEAIMTPTIEYIYHTYVVKDQEPFKGVLW